MAYVAVIWRFLNAMAYECPIDHSNANHITLVFYHLMTTNYCSP